jgi:hypothetical protein
VALGVPAALDLAGTPVTDAANWCVRAARDLTLAQVELAAAVAATEAAQAVGLPASASAEARAETAAALDKFQHMLRQRHTPTQVGSKPPINAAEAEIENALRRLDPDADEQERVAVLRVAAQVARQTSSEVSAQLLGLRECVRSANAAVARRRLAAQWLAALEEAEVAGLLPRRPFAGMSEKLHAVVKGDAQLTDGLRREAARTLDAARRHSRAAFVLETARSCFAELGYQVEDEFDGTGSGRLGLRRAAWGAEHSAALWLEPGGTLRGRVLRRHPGAGDEDTDAQTGRELCDEFQEGLIRLGTLLNTDAHVVPGRLPLIQGDRDAVARAIAVPRPEQRQRAHEGDH